MTIAIPYINSVKEELRYALRSMEKNLPSDVDLIILGEKPDYLHKDVRVIRIGRRQGYMYSKFDDQRKKLGLVAALDEVSDDFIWTYDDIIWLRPAMQSTIMQPRALQVFDDEAISRLQERTDRWAVVLYDTVKRLQKENVANKLYHYETHLPRTYNKANVLRMFRQLPWTTENPYHLATMYFNLYHNKPAIVDVRKDDIKAGFYGTDDAFSMQADHPRQIQDLCQDKLWLNFNDRGYNEAMRSYLRQQFPNLSRWERF